MKYVRSNSIVERAIAGEHLLVPIRGEVADLRNLFALNASAKILWDALAEPADEDRLVGLLLKKFRADEPTVRNDVRELLGQMVARKLVEANP